MALQEIRAGKTIRIPYTFQDATQPAVPYTNPRDIAQFAPATSGPPFFDPVSLPRISIFDPGMTMQVVSVQMVKDSISTDLPNPTGHYHYDYATPAGGLLGTWKAEADANDGNGNPSGSGEPDECFALIAA